MNDLAWEVVCIAAFALVILTALHDLYNACSAPFSY